MHITIHAAPEPARPGAFHYGNIQSRYGVNTRYFTKDGAPFMPVSGEMHYAREPRCRWRSLLLKMKALGLNAVSSYVFWNYHEENKGKFDFSGNRDIGAFLALCREVAMPCILRIGPWCHGEVVYGGFPQRIARMDGARTNDPAYLREVHDFWQALYGQVAPYLDGETVMAIQIENEYNGSVEHVKTLRQMAEDIGFKTPFFTMTGWPVCRPDPALLPMFGDYPDAPWTQDIEPLPANHHFAISPVRSADDIGADLHKNNVTKVEDYADIPYVTCEVGPGNQVTQHRRPRIAPKDAYGMGFVKIAGGVTWQGYYMFTGGSNPLDRPMQESRETGYPNSYPIADYDFQAPIGKAGDVRLHGHLLRQLHLAVTQFDDTFCQKAVFFPAWPTQDPADTSFVRCSVRLDEKGSGYFFVSNYERTVDFPAFPAVSVTVETPTGSIELPTVDIQAGAMFFYPFRITLGTTLFDYILAQPIAKVQEKGETVCYFKALEGIAPCCVCGGVKTALSLGKTGTKVGDARLVVLSEEEAMELYVLDGRAYFRPGTVYADGDTLYTEEVTDRDIRDSCLLEPCAPVELPYDSYLYSEGERAYYRLTLPPHLLEQAADVRLRFAFDGLNLQVFSGRTLINDYFNIDRVFTMYLRDYKAYLERDNTLLIKAVPRTAHGVSQVYEEGGIPLDSTALRLESACIVEYRTEPLHP